MPETRPFYTAEELGIRSRFIYASLKQYVEQDGLGRLISRLPYILDNRPYLTDFLANLYTKGNHRNKNASDHSSTDSPQIQRSEYDLDDWRLFRGAVAEIVCESSLDSCPRETRRLITGQSLAETIRSLQRRNPNFYIDPNNLNFYYRQKPYCCPDCIDISKDTEVSLKTAYEFKATFPKWLGEWYTLKYKAFRQGNLLRQEFTDPCYREVLVKVIAALTRTEESQVTIPEQPEVKLVVAEKAKDPNYKDVVKFLKEVCNYNEVMTVGLSSINFFSSCVIKVMALDGLLDQPLSPNGTSGK